MSICARHRLQTAMQASSTPARPGWLRRGVVPGVVAAAAVLGGVTGCSTAGEETGTTVEDVQEADDDASADAGTGAGAGSGAGAGGLLGQTVTVSANVAEVISPNAFTIAGGDVEELLIVGANQPNNLQPGGLVEVQ